jgi:hypothetical protein
MVMGMMMGFDIDAIGLAVCALDVLRVNKKLFEGDEDKNCNLNSVGSAIMTRLIELTRLEASKPFTAKDCDKIIAEAIALVDVLRVAKRAQEEKSN